MAQRGRKPSFPDQETSLFAPGQLPVETQDMLAQLAERRAAKRGNENDTHAGRLNVTLDEIIRRAFRDANRSRKRS